MAGAARYTAFLDANVLYPALMRDVLLSLAEADLYNAKWSATVQDEWTRNLILEYPDKVAQINRTAAQMCEAIPDCLVTGYEPLIDSLELPDANDRHVLAAAIIGHADAIVSSNAKDFPQDVLEKFNIELQSPDVFIANQLMLHPVTAISAFKTMRARLNKPAMSPVELLALLAKRGMPLSAALLAEAVNLI